MSEELVIKEYPFRVETVLKNGEKRIRNKIVRQKYIRKNVPRGRKRIPQEKKDIIKKLISEVKKFNFENLQVIEKYFDNLKNDDKSKNTINLI